MATSTPRRRQSGGPARLTAPFLICLCWLLVITLAVAKLRRIDGIVVAVCEPRGRGDDVGDQCLG